MTIIINKLCTFIKLCNYILCLPLLLCADFVDSQIVLQGNSSLDSPAAGSRDRKTQPRSHSAPFEANVIQSSLFSATVPLVSASVASPQEASPGARQESLSGDESGIYSEDALPVSFQCFC